MEFAIPLCREELLKDDGKGTYAVKECLASVELVRRIDECQSLFAEIGPVAIIECFDVFFSVLQHFTNADPSVKESYWNCIMEGLVDLCKMLDEADWMSGSGGCPSNKLELRNTLKMLVYVVVQFAEAFENEAVKPTGLEIPTRRRKKKTVSVRGSGSCVWEMEREKVIQTLLHLLELQLIQLCDPPMPEMLDNFTNIVAGCCFKLLENPAVVQDKDVSELIFNLLGVVVKTYNQGVGISLKAVQLLQHFEHIVSPLARAVAVIANKFEVHSFVADIIREVGQKDPSELSTDTSGTRYYAAFIVEVAQVVPGLICPSISHLLPHLNGESHTMRNGVLAVIGAVVSHEMADPVNLSEQQRDTRDQLLDKLQDHLHDVNAFVRSKSLNIWQQLCNDKAIPLPRLKVVLDLAVGRLRDKSSLVRKNAVQLLTTFLTRNPFAATLKLEEYRSKLEAAKNDLRQLLPDGEAEGSRDAEQVGEVAQQLVVVKFLQDAVEFTEKMIACVPVAAQLLGSRVTSDILEALEFLAVCQQFGLQGAHDGLRKALALVWSSEASVKTAVTNVYVRLYLTSDETASSRHQVADVVRNLLSLVSGATVGELTSLEELLVLLMKAGKISKPALQMLVDIVAGRVPSFTDACQAMLLLSMVARVDREIVSSNIGILVQNGLGKDLGLARNCCLALQQLAAPTKVRMPASHQLFQRLSCLMTDEISNTATVLWCPFAEQAIATIFKLAEQPDHVCATVLKDVCYCVLGNNDNSLTGQSYSVLLSRLFFMAGQVIKEQMIHLEVAVLKEMKRRRLQHEEQNVKESSSRSAQNDKGRRSINKQASEMTSMEEEMGFDGAAADDMEGELMRRVCEEDVCGSGLMASLLPLIVMVLSNPSLYPSVQLQSSAVLALSKYMLVSSSVCECYLQLMFTLLEKSPTPCIRANAVVALGDMAVRFPNLIEPWTHHLYARVRDNSSLVRHHAIVVLTHLVLNDMIKVHGSISEMALCLEDKESCIADRARLFFLELSKKGNTLYNVIPDVVSRLSDPSLSVSETGFRAIMKYILGFIQKDKQNENLVDKLCHRLRAARTEEQWRDMAFCLSQLNYSEKCLHKLQDNFACYQNKLTENGVYTALFSILQKAKKFSKPEVKALVEELEVKMLAAHRKGLTERLEPTEAEATTEGDRTITAEGEEETNNTIAPTPHNKTPQSRTAASSERRRQPLSDHNRSMDQEEGDDFKLSAVSSARRSGSRSRIAQTSVSEDEDFVKPRKRKGKGVIKKQSTRRTLRISDSDEN